MTVKPISYLQTDSRWKNIVYSINGTIAKNQTTIGKAGCGITTTAMIIASLKDKSVTPKTTCAWSINNNGCANNNSSKQGTYYSYFVPQLEKYGINASRINTSNIYGLSTSIAITSHNKALAAIKAGNWVICCMGKGNWTSSGHYILWYGINGNTALINDPNSTKITRTNGNLSLLQSQVKYYWIIEVPVPELTEVQKMLSRIKKVITVIHDENALSKQLNTLQNTSIWYILDQLLKKLGA